MPSEIKLNELAIFGLRYIRWGSRLFIVGLCLQLVPLAHYYDTQNDTFFKRPLTPQFFNEVSLWFGCPAEMAAQILMIGGLILFVLGLTYSLISRYSSRAVTSKERLALALCVGGLIAEVVGGAGLYQIYDFGVEDGQTNFYFGLVEPERTYWVGAQLVSFLIYFAGILLALDSLKKEVKSLLVEGQPQ